MIIKSTMIACKAKEDGISLLVRKKDDKYMLPEKLVTDAKTIAETNNVLIEECLGNETNKKSFSVGLVDEVSRNPKVREIASVFLTIIDDSKGEKYDLADGMVELPYAQLTDEKVSWVKDHESILKSVLTTLVLEARNSQEVKAKSTKKKSTKKKAKENA